MIQHLFWIRMAAILCALAVMAGAFGAHALKGRISTELLDVYRTAVMYHFFHALGLFVIAWLQSEFPNSNLEIAFCLMLGGILVFSGSLYALSCGAPKWFGAITPIGGLSLIASWIIVASRIHK